MRVRKLPNVEDFRSELVEATLTSCDMLNTRGTWFRHVNTTTLIAFLSSVESSAVAAEASETV